MRTIYADEQVWPPGFIPSSPEALFARQMFQESKFKRDAVSPAGARGPAQFMPITQRDMTERFGFPENWDVTDPQLAREAQETLMFNLLGQPWVKGNEANQWVKALAAYNYGPTNTLRLLEKLKGEGLDIYESTDWTSRLPEETRKYVQNITQGFPPELESQYQDRLPIYFDWYPNQKQFFGMGEPARETAPQYKSKQEPERQQVQTLDPRLEQAFKILKKQN